MLRKIGVRGEISFMSAVTPLEDEVPLYWGAGEAAWKTGPDLAGIVIPNCSGITPKSSRVSFAEMLAQWRRMGT